MSEKKDTICKCGKEKAFDEETCPECQATKKQTGQGVVIKRTRNGVQKTSPAEMISLAISSGADLDKLEKLLALQERYDANEAKKVYNTSMVAVHKAIPLVGKTLKNAQTHSNYASLDNIICKTKEIYTKQGFSISFYEGTTEKTDHVRICADVIHSKGHKESYFYDVPLDGVGIKGNANMTAIHAKASSTSYGRRYLMCMIWNIPTGDDDGNATGGVEAKPDVDMPKKKEENGKQKESFDDLLVCGDCQKEITKKVHDYSKEKYKMPLCYDCQKKVK